MIFWLIQEETFRTLPNYIIITPGRHRWFVIYCFRIYCLHNYNFDHPVMKPQQDCVQSSNTYLAHCKNNLVVLTTEWLPWLQTNCGYESVTLVLKSNCIRKPKGQLPSSSYNHNTLKTLITSLIPSSGYMKVPYCNFEVHL